MEIYLWLYIKYLTWAKYIMLALVVAIFTLTGYILWH